MNIGGLLYRARQEMPIPKHNMGEHPAEVFEEPPPYLVVRFSGDNQHGVNGVAAPICWG